MSTLLVLQHAEVETIGTLAAVLEAKGHKLRTIRTFAGEPVPPDLGHADGLIVLGGPMAAYDTLRCPFLLHEITLIQAALDAGKPILGVCLGCQLLASALGAKVYPGPAKEIGWFPVQIHPDFRSDHLFADVPSTFTAFHWHGDIFDLPRGARSLGHSARTLHQGFCYGPSVYGILFHLEVTDEQVGAMAAAFPQEMAAANTNADTIAAGKQKYLNEVQNTGRLVFSAFADMLPATAAPQAANRDSLPS